MMRTIFALAALVGSAATVQEPPKPELAVDGHYETSGGMAIDVLGGCRLGVPDQISCWDVKGKPDEGLAKQVKTALLGSGQTIQFRFGREIKCLVTRHSQRLGLNYQTVGGGHINSISLQQGSTDVNFNLLFPQPDVEASTIDVVANLYNVEKPKNLEFPFRKGERFQFEGATFEIGEAAPYQAPKPPPTDPRWGGGRFGYMPPAFNGMFYPDSKLWLVGVGYAKTEDRGLISGFAALDKEGRPIYHVDKNGEPVPATEVLAKQPPASPGFMPSPDPNVKPPKYRPAIISPSGMDVNGAFGYVMNINPARIAKLQVFAASNRTVRFNKLPLDVQNP